MIEHCIFVPHSEHLNKLDHRLTHDLARIARMIKLTEFKSIKNFRGSDFIRLRMYGVMDRRELK